MSRLDINGPLPLMGEQPKFTAGPWRPYFCGADDTVVLAGNAPIAKMAARTEDGTAELDANTLLIAAAPELYESVRALLHLIPADQQEISPICRLAKLALAKADGA